MIRHLVARFLGDVFSGKAPHGVADPNRIPMAFPADRIRLGDHWFRRYLEAREPRLRDPQAPALERANLIRGLVFEHVVRARLEPILQLRDDDGFHVFRRSPSELFMALDQMIGGILCTGSAYALMKVYELFGLSCFLYNMGVEGTGFTHAVTVVAVDHGGRTLAVIEDPHFNVTVVHDDGSPADFFEALALLRDRKHHLLRREMDRERGNFRISWKKRYAGDSASRRWGAHGNEVIDLGDGRVAAHRVNDQDKWAERIDMPALLGPLGYPTDILYLLCFPINVVAGGSDGDRAAGIMTRIRSILSSETANALR